MGAPGLSGRGEAKFSELLPYGVLRSSLSAMRALDRAPFREYDANVTRPEDAGRRRRTQLPVLLLDQGLATLPTSCRRAVRRASMTTENTPAPDTIVLVHGLWVTPPAAGSTGSSTTRAAATACSRLPTQALR